jgi:hypothetical protein
MNKKFLVFIFLAMIPIEIFSVEEDFNVFKFIGYSDTMDQAPVVTDFAKSINKSLSVKEFKLWQRTGGFRSRDPLYLIPSRELACDCDKIGLSCHLFFNRSATHPLHPNMVLNSEATSLLLDFANGGMLTNAQLRSMDNILRILPYMDQITTQEHRVGGMFQFGFNYGRWIFKLDTLLMCAEKNFWAKDKGIRKELMKGTSAGEAYRVRFGLGDTRLKVGYKLFNSDKIKLALGVNGILPTSRFFRKDPSTVIKTKAGDKRQQLLDDLLDVNRYLMIEPRLGTGHWGLGLFADTRIALIKDTLDIWGRVSYDHLFDGKENRFMPSNKKLQVRDLSNLLASDTVPSDFPIADAFPQLVNATVSPGDIFNTTVGLDYKFCKNWKIGVGYDFYMQQAEKIRRISADPNVDTSLLAIDDAIASRVIQHKIFGDIGYTKKGRSIDLNFSVGGDMTVARQNVARDWTVFAKVGIKF